MRLRELHVDGYRTLRNVHLTLDDVTVVTGGNGTGKSNLYRALHLVHAAAAGRLSAVLAAEGGMPSCLWAGERRRHESTRVTIGVTLDDWDFELELGPVPTSPDDPTLFRLDPDVKREALTVTAAKRRSVLMERKGPSAFVRDADGNRANFPVQLWGGESILGQLSEPHRFPVLAAAQVTFRSWRFFHHFRTDAASPLRAPQVGIRTPVLADDGRDLAAALQTIYEIGDERRLRTAIDDAFPGTTLQVREHLGFFTFEWRQPGLARPLEPRELSDGTLRYLCLTAALLSPRPPPFLALNEPESSLHPELLEPLGALISDASRDSQILVTSHAEPLTRALASRGARRVELTRLQGATVVSE